MDRTFSWSFRWRSLNELQVFSAVPMASPELRRSRAHMTAKSGLRPTFFGVHLILAGFADAKTPGTWEAQGGPCSLSALSRTTGPNLPFYLAFWRSCSMEGSVSVDTHSSGAVMHPWTFFKQMTTERELVQTRVTSMAPGAGAPPAEVYRSRSKAQSEHGARIEDMPRFPKRNEEEHGGVTLVLWSSIRHVTGAAGS